MPSIFKRTTPSPEPEPTPGIRRITAGTPQQEALWAALLDGTHHVLAEARAGCGKSSSCREGMWRIIDRAFSSSMVYTVFNKANATEFSAQCPPGVTVATTHSLGVGALARAGACVVERNKSYIVLDQLDGGKSLPRYLRKAVSTLVGHAKNQGIDPRLSHTEAAERLASLLDYFDVETYRQADTVVDYALDVLAESLRWTELIDFDDMLWIPALMQMEFAPCDLLFLDEVQDFNPVQQLLVPLMSRSGRVVLVGDRHQAINAFRGADMDSIPRLSAALAETERGLCAMPLTVTFRCPKSHVALANAFVPDLQAAPTAPDGEIEEGVPFDSLAAKVRPGDLVISPVNAPLIKSCLRLIGRKVPSFVRGRAIGDGLLAVLNGIKEARTVADLEMGVLSWLNKELGRLSRKEGSEDAQEAANDRASGLLAVLDACDSPGDAPVLIVRLFAEGQRTDQVTFSSVHRAKGDEADTVYLLNIPGRAPAREWQVQQNRNLRYVALTRSKNRLIFVDAPPKCE